MNNQHIKNFFLHLKEIDNRNLPSAVKFILFPDKLTKTELNVIKYYVDVTTRTKIFNKMVNNKPHFISVYNFGTISDYIAFANTTVNGPIFIDINGKKSTTGTDLQKLIDFQYDRYIAPYMNSIQNDFIYYTIYFFSNLFVSYACEKQLLTYHKPINVNKFGYPDPGFNPLDKFQERVLMNTIEFLNDIKNYE